MVRPWKLMSKLSISWRPSPYFLYEYFLASLSAASTASVPLLQKNALSPKESRLSLFANSIWGSIMVEVRDVDQLSGLFPDGGHHARMAMSEVADGQAGYEIEIFFSVRIPDTASLATDQSDGVTPVGGGDVLFSVRDQCGIVHAFPQKRSYLTICVPTPSFVNTSSKTA